MMSEDNDFPLFKLRMIEAIASTTSNLDALMCLNQLIGKANARVQADALAEHLSQMNNAASSSSKLTPIKTTVIDTTTTTNTTTQEQSSTKTSPTSSTASRRQIASTGNAMDDTRSVSTRSTRSPPETPEYRRVAADLNDTNNSEEKESDQKLELTPVHGLHTRRGVGGQTSSGGGRSSIIFG